MKTDTFGARSTFDTGHGPAALYRLSVLDKEGVASGLDRLPFSIRVLLESVLRNVDGELVTDDDVKNLASWSAAAPVSGELPFTPGPGDPAGLHRRPRGRRPRGHASGGGRGSAGTRGRSTRWCRWTW